MNVKSLVASWAIALLLLGVVIFVSQPSNQPAPTEKNILSAPEEVANKELTYSENATARKNYSKHSATLVLLAQR